MLYHKEFSTPIDTTSAGFTQNILSRKGILTAVSGHSAIPELNVLTTAICFAV